MPVAREGEQRVIIIRPLHVKGAKDLRFPSIITEFSDTWTPRWSTANVYGRMDPISFYNGTSRELSLGFRIIADDENEALENMGKIEKLIQYQYPTYRRNTGIPVLKAPPYFKFDFMNIVGTGGKQLQGYIAGAIQINPGFQDKANSQYFSSTHDNMMYFSDIKISLKIQVLHEEFVGFTNSSVFKGGSDYPYGIDQTEAKKATQANAASNKTEIDSPENADKVGKANQNKNTKKIANDKKKKEKKASNDPLSGIRVMMRKLLASKKGPVATVLKDLPPPQSNKNKGN
jgi:hypothetical protein